MSIYLGAVCEMTEGWPGRTKFDAQEKINQGANVRYEQIF